MTQDSAVIQNWLDQALASKKLSKWETDFLESLAEQFEEKQWLSLRQQEILEKIYSEKT